MADGLGGVTERGVLTATDEAWTLARSRAAVIAELAGLDVVGHEAVDEAAVAMGISRRQVYSLVARWRSGRGAVSDLLPGRSSGGRGRSRVSVEVDTVIGDVLRARYLRRQRPSVASVHRSILRACRLRGLPAPSRGTVERRIAALEPRVVAAARGGPDAARPLRSAGGEPPRLQRLLEQVQIDHTVIDLVVVDDQLRSPVGRPYLTVAIDVLSRSIVGLVVTLDPPSTTSVGLCLSHMVADKQVWIEQLGAAASWPMSGKPEEVFVDNGAEFHSEALTRGCEEHGIVLTYRPEGAPHYGGVVERLIGTLMREVHELPGTTFSNPADRGTYDSDVTAALTLSELQRWLVLLVSAYHQQVHDTLGRPPAAVWAEHASELPPTVVHDPTAFLVDFLPVLRRRLTRTGVQIDHIQYYADALKPLIARRAQLDRLVVRLDPRDLSRIWVLHPDTDTYLPIGYRYQSRPAISQWEQRAAAARLREQGRSEVDEQALFDTVETMRQISDTAQRSSRSARRARARRPATPRETPAADPPRTEPAAAAAEAPLVQPFADIEQW